MNEEKFFQYLLQVSVSLTNCLQFLHCRVIQLISTQINDYHLIVEVKGICHQLPSSYTNFNPHQLNYQLILSDRKLSCILSVLIEVFFSNAFASATPLRSIKLHVQIMLITSFLADLCRVEFKSDQLKFFTGDEFSQSLIASLLL